MPNPFKLYRKSQEVQLRWIRKHPFQWIALNAILLAAFIGFIQWKDRYDARKFDEEVARQS